MYRNLKVMCVLFFGLFVLITLGSKAQAMNNSLEQEMFVSQPKENLVTKKAISRAEQKAALALWTRETIAATQPLEMPSDLGPAEVDEQSLNQSESLGELGFVAGGEAASDADSVAQAAYPLDWEALEETETKTPELRAPSGTAGIYTNYVVNQATALQNLYPHRTIGRLQFSTTSGTSYCSGTSISGNVMLTAAHCLYDTTSNVWYTNFVFVPAYRNGSAPYGTFPATACYVLNAWVNLSGSYNINSWARHDVGVCKMGNNSAGQTLNTAVGWMGRQWNYPYVRHFHDFGYPFKDYNNVNLTGAGQYLRTCVAESRQQTTETLGIGCYYGGGISGGSWMVGYAPTVVTGYANSVNSGGFVGSQNIYGARFNSNNIVPLCSPSAAGC